jgi:hypothetical protein
MRLRIIACRQVYSGVNTKNGHRYTIYEVDAAKTDGTLITEKLRSFEPLPIGQTVEVSVTAYNSEQHGRSFTLHAEQGTSPSSTEQVNDLLEEFRALKEQVNTLRGRVDALERMLPQGQAPPSQPDGAKLDEKFGADAPW